MATELARHCNQGPFAALQHGAGRCCTSVHKTVRVLAPHGNGHDLAGRLPMAALLTTHGVDGVAAAVVAAVVGSVVAAGVDVVVVA